MSWLDQGKGKGMGKGWSRDEGEQMGMEEGAVSGCGEAGEVRWSESTCRAFFAFAFAFASAFAGASAGEAQVTADTAGTTTLEAPATTPATQPPLLTLRAALELGLERNPEVRIAEQRHRIDQVNRSIGSAGFLPTLELSGSRTLDVEDVVPGAPGSSTARSDLERMGASVDLRWTLFDGLRRFATRGRLAEQERLGGEGARHQVDRTAQEIVLRYFTIVRQEELLRALRDAVSFSEERLRIAQMMRELGSGSEYQVLLARTDLNADRADVIRQEAVVEDAKVALLQLLALPPETEFTVERTVPVAEALSFPELLEGFRTSNREIEMARLRESIARLERSEVRRDRLPTVDLRAGYGISRDDPRLGRSAIEDARGFHVGVEVSLPLFEGLAHRRRGEVAELELRNREIEREAQEQRLEAALRSEYRNFLNAQQLAELEEENLELAQRALRIALEQFQLASITSTELREAQRMVLDTRIRLIDARFDAKAAETELLRLSGRLVE